MSVKRFMIKSVKVYNRSKSLYTKPKDALNRINDIGHTNSLNTQATGYATDRMMQGGKQIVKKITYRLVYSPRRIKQYLAKSGRNFRAVRHISANARADFIKGRAEIKKLKNQFSDRGVHHAAKQSHAAAKASKAADQAKATVTTAKQTLRQTKKTSRQTIKTAKSIRKSGDVKALKKTIKTKQKAAKASVKTAKTTAKTANRSAKAATKAANASVKAAAKSSKTAVKSVKVTAKAAVAAVKSTIAAVKGAAALIAAGGWIVIFAIVLIVVAGGIVNSVMGIFFSDEQSGSGLTLQSVMEEINEEYREELDNIDNKYKKYDVRQFSGERADWDTVLALYSVKVNTDPDDPDEVVTMTKRKQKILKEIFWDMHEFEHGVEDRKVKMTYVDADGTETVKEETKIYLVIKQKHVSPGEMADKYGFTDEQKELLTEMLSELYEKEWSNIMTRRG